MYDPYGAYGTGGYDPYSQQGAVGGADMSGDPSAPPPMTGAGGDAAGLGVGDSTTHPSKQLPPAKTDTSDMGEGSSDPLAPLEDKKPGFKPPKPPTANNGKGAGAGGAAAGGQDAKGGGTCPSCGAAVQAGWFICPKCKNPLS